MLRGKVRPCNMCVDSRDKQLLSASAWENVIGCSVLHLAESVAASSRFSIPLHYRIWVKIRFDCADCDKQTRWNTMSHLSKVE